jgi:hypothetical protein
MTAAFRYALLVISLVSLALLAACSDSGAAADGDVDGDGSQACVSDEDCSYCKLCLENTSGGKSCQDLPCEENIDCADLGAGVYCQFGTCICPGDGDSDGDTPDGDKPDGDTPDILVQPATLNFGAVQIGETIPKTLEICNVGGGTLELNSLYFQQLGVAPGEEEFRALGSGVPSPDNIISLAAGDCHELDVAYTPVNPSKDEGTLLIGSNVGLKTVGLISEEKGQPVMSASCESIDPDFVPPSEEWVDACSFGFVPLGQTTVMQISLENLPLDASENAVLVITDITLSDPENPDDAFIRHYRIDQDTIDYADNGREIWLGKSQEEVFNLVYQPQQAGVHYLEIQITHNDPNPDLENPYIVRVIGAGVVPELLVNPERISFGNVEKGKCKTINVELTNRGGAQLNIEDTQLSDTTGVMDQVFSLNLDPDADTVPNIPMSLEIGETGTVDLTCCPVGNEAYINTLNIVSNHKAMNRWVTEVGISCSGVEAFCDIWPSELAFGSVRVGETSTRVVSIGNNGQATARVIDLYIDGSLNFSLDSIIQLPMDIAPGERVDINVDFTSTSIGAVNGELVVKFRDGDCQETTIPLSGGGIEPNLTGPEDCLAWENEQVPPTDIPEDQLADWVRFQPVTIRNEGNDTLVISEVFLPAAFEDWFVLDLPGDSGRAQIPPGGAWTFDIGYKPVSYGEHNGVVVVCSDARNAGGSSFHCTDAGSNASEICLVGTAIDPRFYVEPSSGRMTFAGVIVGDDPPAPQLVTLHNFGTGPVEIEEIALGYGSNDIHIVSMQHDDGNSNVTDLLTDWPSEGVQLTGGGGANVTIAIQCTPQIQGQHYRALEITHSDKDMTKPGGVVGSEYPVYLFEIVCYSGENGAPTAIVKSPAGTPAGPYGTRSISINKGEEIVLDGSASYDPDAPTDSIVSYTWTASDPAKVAFTMPTNTSVTRARFDNIGTYTVSLRVTDSHNEPSDANYRDSQLEVKVFEAPRPVAYQCETFARYFETEVGVDLCFDGTSSRDQNNQAVTEYQWYLKKLGGAEFNFSTSPTAHYTLTAPGTYEVKLHVVDRNGNRSVSPAVVDVDAFADESIRVELTWTGRGDVSLHYIRPNGYLGDVSDCNEGNPRPNWSPYGFGHPAFEQASSNGVGPEVVVHPDPGDGTYRFAAVYETPTQDCGYETECRHYSSNCDICDCDCKPFCLILRICCNSCDKCEQKWVCEDVPAMLTYKIFVNDASYPSFVKAGSDAVVTERYDTHEFSLTRNNGGWLLNR